MKPDTTPQKAQPLITDKLIEKISGEEEDRAENEKFNDELRQTLKEELKEQKARNDHNRSETFKDIFHFSIGFVLRILLWGSALILIVRIWHLVIPSWQRWLSEDELGEIDKLLSYIIVGSFGSFVMKYMQKNID